MVGPDLKRLLDYLKKSRGFDFGGYKGPSLTRRIQRRMELLGTPGFDEYLDYLEVHPGEVAELFDSILINVTSFFRDAQSWHHLGAGVLPKILGARGGADPVRVWSAGCATGQEPYTLVMLLAEALGAAAFLERVKIYATDLDEKALAAARAGAYGARDLEDVAPQLRERYFQPQGKRLVFRADLRRAVIFGRHDMMSDPPIGGLDLIVCRNTLMYFNADVQGRIVSRFHFALNDGGYLFLGKAERLLARGTLFQPVDPRSRIFAKVAAITFPDARYVQELQTANEGLESTNEALRSTNEELETMNEALQSANDELQSVNDQLRQSTEEADRRNAFLESVLAGMGSGAAVLDRSCNVLVWNHRAEDLWGLRADEVRGKSFLGLDMGLPVAELRPMVRACLSGEAETADATLDAVNRRGKRIRCRVACTPLACAGKREGVILTMDEVA